MLTFTLDKPENVPGRNEPPPAAVTENVRHWIVPAVRVTPPPVAFSVRTFEGARTFALIVMPPPLDVRLIAPEVVVTPEPITVKLPVLTKEIVPLVEFTIWRLETWNPP